MIVPVDGDDDAPLKPRHRPTEVLPLRPDDATRTLATVLNPRIRVGASTWSYPGWAGIVWDEGSYGEALLTKNGLTAEAQYTRHAGQAADHFNCVIQAMPTCHWQRRSG